MSRFLVLIILTELSLTYCQCHKHPDFGLNEKQLIPKYGYPLEVHQVQTEDGYLLELHRIPYGKFKKPGKKRSAVILVPGILSSSSTWINFGPDRSFGYILADQGYDVWLVNNRGTTWSKGHIYLNSTNTNKEYWSFSLHEIGYYDMPAIIDYVLKVTKQEKLFYVGYSQGTTVYFIMLSEKPEYNQKICLMISISTTISFKNYKLFAIQLAGKYRNLINDFVINFGYYEFLPRQDLTALTIQSFCNNDSPLQPTCFEIFTSFIGFQDEQLNKTLMPLFSSTAPNGCSAFQLEHSQQLSDDEFRKFDFGSEKNLKEYGQLVPPKYDITKATVPMALYHGQLDELTIVETLDKLNGLPNIVAKKVIPKLGHLDVIWGYDAPDLVYHDAVKLMKKFR